MPVNYIVFFVCLPASIYFILIYMCVCLCVLSTSIWHVFMGICGLQNGVPDSLELELLTVMSIWHHYWELNSSSLEEQYTLLTAESFIYHLLFLIRIFSLKLELSLIWCALTSIFFLLHLEKHFQIRSDSEVPGGHRFGLAPCTLLPQDWAILPFCFCILKMKYVYL